MCKGKEKKGDSDTQRHRWSKRYREARTQPEKGEGKGEGREKERVCERRREIEGERERADYVKVTLFAHLQGELVPHRKADCSFLEKLPSSDDPANTCPLALAWSTHPI
jgi:hypothetical protein